MTQPRKKPICHSCGLPMAGHKRPNGSPVCPKSEQLTSPRAYMERPSPSALVEFPSPLAPNEFFPPSPPNEFLQPSPPDESPQSLAPMSLEAEHIWRKTGFYHYQNPNWIDHDVPSLSYGRRSIPRNDTPNTWVSTEPADDIPVKDEGFGELVEIREEEVHLEHEIFPSSQGSTSSISSSSSTSSVLTRRFTKLLGNSKPLASVFSTPREEVVQLTKAARQFGLFTGIMHRPQKQPRAVKEEGSFPGRATSPPPRGNSWWVFLGKDPEVVEHFMEMQDRDTIYRHSEMSMSREDMMLRTMPLRSKSMSRPFFVDMVIAGLCGGLALFVLLSIA